MRVVKMAIAVSMLAATTAAAAQQSGIRVYAIRVLATDPEALAAFYEVNAKYRWNARDHFKTGLYMALSVYNNRLAAAFTHLAGSR